jgi:hypothetical protein
MRTTLNIDDDVLEEARKAAEKRNVPFRWIVNEALRAGMHSVREVPATSPYRTIPRKMSLKEGMNLDNVREFLSRIEGEESR